MDSESASMSEICGKEPWGRISVFYASYDNARGLESKRYSVAALYERRQTTEVLRYVFGGHRPPLQMQSPADSTGLRGAADREKQTAGSLAQKLRYARSVVERERAIAMRIRLCSAG